jgi:phosphohistidine phosphatase SixA
MARPSTGAADPAPRRFLILVRHASRARTARPEREHLMDGWPAGQQPAKVPEDGTSQRRSGWGKTRSIAIALADRLSEEDVRVSHILHSPHEVARQTAIAFAAVLCRTGPVAVESCAWLAPEERDGLESGRIRRALDALWERESPHRLPDQPGVVGRAIVLVGHQPQLTRIADAVLRRSWRRLVRRPMALPVGSSEAGCIRVSRWPRLRWLLTEKGEELAKELKDKLRSKVDTAKFFLGALAVNAGLIVNTGVWGTAGEEQLRVLAAGGVLIFCGLLLAVATLLGYDSLNMPPALWAEPARGTRRRQTPCDVDPPSRSVMRPPSEASVVLFYEMIKTWNRFFVPALICSVSGVSLFLLTLLMARHDALAAMGSPPPQASTGIATAVPAPMDSETWLSAAGLLVGIAVLAAFAYRRWGPRLGTED